MEDPHPGENYDRSQSPTGYQKRTAQILRATHFYDFVVNVPKMATFLGRF